MHYTLIPAYGRDYKSAAAVRRDFEDNKDFILCGMLGSPHQLINREQLPDRCEVNIRYKNRTQVCVIKHRRIYAVGETRPDLGR